MSQDDYGLKEARHKVRSAGNTEQLLYAIARLLESQIRWERDRAEHDCFETIEETDRQMGKAIKSLVAQKAQPIGSPGGDDVITDALTREHIDELFEKACRDTHRIIGAMPRADPSKFSATYTWHPVSEEPPKDDFYLAHKLSGWVLSWWDKETGWIHEHITHWTELPKPPEEKP